jgi:hypothetical protein
MFIESIQRAVEERIRQRIRSDRKRKKKELLQSLPRDHDVPKYIYIPATVDILRSNTNSASNNPTNLSDSTESVSSSSETVDSYTSSNSNSNINENTDSKSVLLEDVPIDKLNIMHKIYLKTEFSLYMMIYQGRWKMAFDAIVAKPELAMEWKTEVNKYGKVVMRMLPIHAALKFNAPLKLIQLLIQSYPECVCDEDNKCRLPLHHACNMKVEWMAEVVTMLLNICPDTSSHKDARGMLPLHILGLNKATLGFNINYDSIILKLLDAFPEGGSDKDSAGRLYTEYQERIVAISPLF